MKKLIAAVLCCVMMVAGVAVADGLEDFQGTWLCYAARSGGKEVQIELLEQDLGVIISSNNVTLLSNTVQSYNLTIQMNYKNQGLEISESDGDSWTALRIDMENSNLKFNMMTSNGGDIDYIFKRVDSSTLNYIYDIPDSSNNNTAQIEPYDGDNYIMDRINIENYYHADITFLDIPFMSKQSYVNEYLQKNYGVFLDDYGFENSSMYKIQEIIGEEAYNYTMNYDSNVCDVEFVFDPPIKAGGYDVGSLGLYFVCNPVDGHLIRDADNAVLYAAKYSFDTDNLQGMFNDLTQKLGSIYGDCVWSGTDIQRLFGKGNIIYSSIRNVEYMIWKSDTNYASVVLKSVDYDDNSAIYSDTIQIMYIWHHGDQMIDEAIEIDKQERIAQESTMYGNGDVDGL